MTNKLTGRLTAVLSREPRQLVVGGVLKVQPIIDGVYVSGSFQGEANGWYNDNLPGLVPVGLWDSLGNRTDANGLYENNIKITMDDGLWVAEVYQGPVHGYYQHNAPALMDPGLWVDNTYQGIVTGWYVSNVRMTLTNGLWVDEVYQGAVSGYYVDNAPAPVPDAVWDGGVDTGLAQGWYEANKPALVPSGIWNGGANEGLATGIYRQNIIQKNQFQDVLESLRIQHQPEHWASWALDGSLEEDAGQFPIVHQSPRLEWVQVGSRLGLSGALNNAELGFQCGTNSDFNYVHNEREFTIGFWANTKNLPVNADILGTNMSSNLSRGFTFFKVAPRGAYYIYLYGDSLWQANATTGVFDHFEFVVIRNFPSLANSYNLFTAAQPILSSNMTPSGDFGDSFGPMGFLRGRTGIVPPIILNAFATSQVLTDAEIYRLYVAGLNDIQVF